MLSLLRKINRTHLVFGVSRKYLFYAIGEIVLIVFGILIALQINNWNTERKTRKAEFQLLLSLKEEVAANRDQMVEALSYTKRSMASARKIVEIYQQDYRHYESSQLDSLLGQIQWAWTFDPAMGVPISIRSSGQINTIRNLELRLFVASFEELVNDVKEEGGLLRKLIIEQFTPMIGQYVSSNNRSNYIGKGYAVVESSIFKSDYVGLFEDREVENLITYIHVWRNDQITEETALLERLNEVLEIIEREIKRWN